MEAVAKLESLAYEQLKKMNLPRLPKGLRVWIGDNVWWLAAFFSVLFGISALPLIFGFITTFGALVAPVNSLWYVGSFTGWVVVTNITVITFTVLNAALLGAAVNPLKESQKQGWTLLFVLWLVNLLSLALNVLVSVLTLNIFNLMGVLIFGTAFLVISAYFLFEIRGEFAHVEKSAGIKHRKTAKKS